MKLEIARWREYPLENDGLTHTVTGTIKTVKNVWSPQLRNTRDLFVYLPPSYSQNDRHYPVLYMHDGQNLFDEAIGFAGQEWQVDETMEYLATEGLEAIVVGICHMNQQRVPEYNPFPGRWEGLGAKYLNFVIHTVKPMIDRDFRTLDRREATGIMGSSMGGLISLYSFFERPDVFGYVGAMSPAFWINSGEIYRYVQRAAHVPGKIYLDNGTREGSASRMNSLLVAKGYQPGRDLMYVVEKGAEHTETAWARRLPDALRFLLT